MDKFWIVVLVPILWFSVGFLYQICHLLFLWIKYKLEEMKEII